MSDINSHALIYISGAVTGVADYKELFASAEKDLMRGNYRVCNPTLLCQDDWTWEQCMKTVLKAMVDCDALALLDNWRESRGAKIEVALAKELGIKIEMLSHYLSHKGQ